MTGFKYTGCCACAGDWWSISIVLISVGMTIFLGFSFYKRWSESHRAQLVHLLG